MLKFKIKILSLLLFVLFSKQISAQNAEAYTRLDTNAIVIGDQIGLEMGIKLPIGFVTTWPNLTDTISKNIELISKSKIDTLFDDDQMILHQLLTITSFDSGVFEVPGYVFQFGKEGDTLAYQSVSAKQYLQVFVPEVDTSQAFKVIKAPFAEPYTFMEIFPWVAGGLLLIGLIIATIWYVRRRMKNKPVFASKPKPLRPPEEVALEKLETLRLSKVWQQGHIKNYHSQLTDIIREYLDRRYNFDAPEMTSDEIMNELKELKVNKEVTSKLSAAFNLSDLVKFAKAQPTALENDLSLVYCTDFVNETAYVKEQEPIVNVSVVEPKIEGGSNV